MEIREKLIELLDEESITDERANFLALAAIRELRCENCKHWFDDTDSAWGFAHCDSPDSPASLAKEYGERVAPNFFCALFESKCRSDENQTAGASK